MLITKLGSFNGKSWEDLCQQIFKLKYAADGYQHIPADPGDFGLEGFTLKTATGFQCYCPEKNYPSGELYEAQRNKITRDIGKLKTNVKALSKRIGSLKLSKWVFVTPIVDKNALLEHVRNKEIEARSWNLDILSDDFEIHIHDLDFYLTEINQIQSINGISLTFEIEPPSLNDLNGPQAEYEGNVLRKSQARLSSKTNSTNIEVMIRSLYDQTLKNFLEGEGFLRKIEKDAPTLYFRLVRLINEYEFEVKEKSLTWINTPEELTTKIRDGLSNRICAELSPSIDETTANQIARHIVSRWLAVCELDFL